jgi:hypothetical protein
MATPGYPFNLFQPGRIGDYSGRFSGGLGGLGALGGPLGLETGLASTVNQFMTQQAKAPWQANYPLFDPIMGQLGQNVYQQAQGKVTDSTINQLLQGAAQRGIITGSPGSPGSNAAYLAALGKTSEQQQALGMQGATALGALTPVPEIWNPMSLYVPERLARMEQGIAQQAEYTRPSTYKTSYRIGSGPWRSDRPLGW